MRPVALACCVFGALFVVLFVIVAIAEGLGDPTSPPARSPSSRKSPTAPRRPSTSRTKTATAKRSPRTSARSPRPSSTAPSSRSSPRPGLKKTPKPGDKQYDELKETTVGSILETIWIQGLAAEEGITVTEQRRPGGTEKTQRPELQNRGRVPGIPRKPRDYTRQDVNERVKIQILSTKIQEELGEGAGEPSKAEIEEYYEEAKSTQFTTPPTVDARILIAKSEKDAAAAKAALLRTTRLRAGKKSSTNTPNPPSPNGGLQPGVTEEQYAGEVGEAMFAAPVGKVEGPVKYATSGFIVFQVEKENAEKAQPLGEAEAQIKAQLQQQSPGRGLQPVRRRLPGPLALAHVLRRRLHGRKMLQLRGRRPARRSRPGLLRRRARKPSPEACPAPVLQNKPALPGHGQPDHPERRTARPARRSPPASNPVKRGSCPASKACPPA